MSSLVVLGGTDEVQFVFSFILGAHADVATAPN